MTQVLTPRSFAGLRVAKAGERPFTFNMLVYGDAGVGKTWFAGSADAVPQMRKVLHLDVESGANTLKQAWPNVDIIEIDTWDKLDQVYLALSAGGHDYQTIILDSLTELNDYCIDTVTKERRLRAKAESEDVLEIYDWNKVASRMMRKIRLFRDLPMSTVFVAHMTEDRDPRSGKMIKQPLLTGQLRKKLPTVPDIVLYQYVEDVEGKGVRRLFCSQKTPTCVAKARGIEMPSVLGVENEVTMQTIYNYAQKAITNVNSG